MAITLNGTTGITTPDVDSTDLTATGNFTSRGIDDNATSTAMTLDTGGNLLVGQTTANSFNLTSGFGFDVRQTYGLGVAVQDNPTAIFNRTNTDGDIMQFRKDGSTVGSIGSNSTKLTIGGTATYDPRLRFGQTNNLATIQPADNTGGLADDTVNFGQPNYRFKDLYLSGGVFLGGTGSANKLDDYEEGAFTPTSLNSGTLTFSSARYTKIGRHVTIHVENLKLSDTTSGTSIALGGLPFTCDEADAVGSVMASYRDDNVAIAVFMSRSSDEIRFYKVSDTGAFLRENHNMFNNSLMSIYFSMSYITAA